MMDQYRKMFDQVVEQLGPEQAEVDTLRGSLARRCLEEQTKKEVRPMRKHAGLLRAAVAAALCLALVGTALASSAGLREMLAAALGGFAPYAQEQEGEPYVIDGIEFRVKSVLADDFTVRAYVEARDVAGDIFDKIDDMAIPGRFTAWVNHPANTDVTDVISGGAGLAEFLGYDEETGTALLAVSGWGIMPEDFADTAVEMDYIISYPMGAEGDYEFVWQNTERMAIPVEVTPVESIALDKDSPLVSGLDAVKAYLSPLGLSCIVENYEIRRYDLEEADISVKLKDGSVVNVSRYCSFGIFPPPFGESSYRMMIWNFLEPVEADQIEGVYVDGDYFPMQ